MDHGITKKQITNAKLLALLNNNSLTWLDFFSLATDLQRYFLNPVRELYFFRFLISIWMAVDKIFLIKPSYILRNIFQGCHWWLNIFLCHFLYRIIYYRGENSRSFLLNSFNVLKIFDKKDMKRYFSPKARKILICASFKNTRKTLSYTLFDIKYENYFTQLRNR